MFGTIRRHQTWLWAIIITLTIISFVIFFSPYSRVGPQRGAGNLGSINGQRIGPERFGEAVQEVRLRYFFMSGGRFPDQDARQSGFDLDRETYQWLLLVQQQERLGIHVSSDAIAQVGRGMIGSLQKMGVTSAQVFEQQVLRPNGLELQDFERYIRHALGLQELSSVVALSGQFVTPAEARDLYVRDHQEMATEAVFFPASNYLASITVTPEALGQYYTNHLAEYRIPDRVQVSYVKYGLSNYLGQAETELSTNLNQLVEVNMQRIGTNYLRLAKTPAEAKLKLREEIVRDQALRIARKQAADFARPLFDLEPLRAENLEKMAKDKGVTVSVTPPFSREEGPKDLEVGADFVQRAFSLSPENPFAGPLVGQDGVYILACNKTIPSEIPPLDQIRERVTAEYKHTEAVMKARLAGVEFDRTLTNAVAQGKSFSAACAEAKLAPASLPPFSLSSRELPDAAADHVEFDQLKRIAFNTQPGKMSSFQATADGGLILFTKSNVPLSEATVQADLPAYLKFLRQRRQEEAFNRWFSREAEKGLRDTPLGRPQKAPPALGSRRAAKS